MLSRYDKRRFAHLGGTIAAPPRRHPKHALRLEDGPAMTYRRKADRCGPGEAE